MPIDGAAVSGAAKLVALPIDGAADKFVVEKLSAFRQVSSPPHQGVPQLETRGTPTHKKYQTIHETMGQSEISANDYPSLPATRSLSPLFVSEGHLDHEEHRTMRNQRANSPREPRSQHQAKPTKSNKSNMANRSIQPACP